MNVKMRGKAFTKKRPSCFCFAHKLFRADVSLLEIDVAVLDTERTDVAITIEPLQ